MATPARDETKPPASAPGVHQRSAPTRDVQDVYLSDVDVKARHGRAGADQLLAPRTAGRTRRIYGLRVRRAVGRAVEAVDDVRAAGFVERERY